MGLQDHLPTNVMRWKLAWFRHIMHHGSLAKIIFQGTLEVGNAIISKENAGWTM